MINARPRRASLLALIAALAVALGFGQPLSAQVADAPANGSTVAVLSVAHYDKLISDIGFLGSLGGNPQAGQMIEGAITFFTQGKGLAAIDRTQPWGVVVQTDGVEFSVIGCLPVTRPDDLLEVAVNFNAQVEEVAPGIKQLTFNEQTFFVKPQDGWTFVGTTRESLDQVPANPQALLGELAADYDLAASVSVREVPEMYRQLALTAMQAGMQQQLMQQSDETDEQFQARRQLAEAELERWSRMINDIESITLGWAIDAEQQRTYLDYTQVFVPGSRMAEQVAAYGQPKTNFAGFYQPDAALTMSFVSQADPELIEEDIESLESMMRTTRQQINKGIDESDEHAESDEARELFKAAIGDVLDALVATIKTGQLDGGAAVHISPDRLTLVAGALVEEPARIESALKKLQSAAQLEGAEAAVLWNAESHAGVDFHTLSVPVPADQEGPRRLLGSEFTMAIGIGPQAVYVAAGREYLEAIKQAIDASAADPDKAVPPFELAVSLGPILEVAAVHADDEQQRAVVQSMANTIRNEAPGRDHIRAVGQLIPNGLRYRFEAEEGVLRAVGKAAVEAQTRAMQAHQ